MEILNYIKNIDKEEKKILFIYGDIGVGKYTFLKNNLKDNYNIKTFTYIDFLYGKVITNIINHKNNLNNVMYMFKKKKKPIIIIKEVEFIKIKTIKKILKQLNIKNIKNKKNKLNIPIIFLGSGQCIKIRKDLSDICKIIKYENNKDIIKNNVDLILKNNNINVDNKIKKYLLSNYNNFHKIKILINILKQNNKKYKYKDLKKFLEVLKKNINYNIELYDNVKDILLNKELNENKVLDYYNLEKILLPLLIHENYKNYINNNLKNDKDKKECILLVSKNLMFCDNINEFIFNNHYWNIQDLFSILCCYYTSYIINHKFIKKNKLKYPKLDYTKILTKNSILFINFKQYKLILHNINYYHNFNKEIINYINKNILIFLLYDINNGSKYLEKYGFNIKDILKLIKFSDEYYLLYNNLKIKKQIEKKLKQIK